MSTVIATEFGVELLKLLLQLASSDRSIHGVEAKVILGLARLWQVPKADADVLAKAMRTGSGLPAPNLAVLRKHPEEVLKSLHQLAQADGTTSIDETELINEVEALIGTTLAK